MPPSQLKRLRSSLKEQGIIGPQQSKKQKRKQAQDAKARNEKRLRRGEALDEIRDQFNPFQYKHNPRGPKFDVTTNKPANDKGIKGRPGVAKALSEERVGLRRSPPAHSCIILTAALFLATGNPPSRDAEEEQSRRHP